MMRAFGLMMVLGILAGCAAVPKDAGLADIQRRTQSRLGQHVQWNRGTEEDHQADEAVHRLLSEEIGPAQAVQIALLNNRRLQAAFQELGLAQAALVQAGLLKNPIFDFERRFHNDGNNKAMEFAVMDDFLHVLLIPLRRRLAAVDLERTKSQVLADILELSAQVQASFYHLQADAQILQMRRTVLEAAEAAYELAQRMQKAGNLNDLALAREQVAYEQARLDLSTVEQGVIEDRERLNTLMGLWGADVTWRIESRLPDLPPEEMNLDHLERRAIETNVDLAALYQRLETAGRQVGLTRTVSAISQVQLGAHVEREPDGLWTAGPALSLPLPLFDQGQAAAASAKARFVQWWNQYTALAVEIRSRVRRVRDVLRLTRQQVIFYRDLVLPLQQRVTEQALLRYNAMQMTQFELLQTKREQVDAGMRYIKALRDYWIARAELEHALAGHVLQETTAGSDSRKGAEDRTGRANPGSDS
ncbi:MAG: TolC family protein [Planctomycetes bacterium]|nr:TolC family protein [Planctomycetota bacterium]